MTPERVKFMSDFVRKYDPTRPVGMACHIPGMAEQPNFDALDLTGWNYIRRYATYRQRYPDKPIIYTESASALSTRGFYELPLPNRKTEYSKQLQVDSYDLNAADWSDIADSEFKLMKEDSFVAGEFVWTGFDYLGEPTPFSQEAKKLLLRHRGPVRHSQGPVLSVPQLLAAGHDHRPHPAALELAGPRRAERAGIRLHQWRFRGAVPQRQVAGPPDKGRDPGKAGQLRQGQARHGRLPANAEGHAPARPTMATGTTRWSAADGGGRSVVAGGPGRGPADPLSGHRLRAGGEELRVPDQGLDRCAPPGRPS